MEILGLSMPKPKAMWTAGSSEELLHIQVTIALKNIEPRGSTEVISFKGLYFWPMCKDIKRRRGPKAQENTLCVLV